MDVFCGSWLNSGCQSSVMDEAIDLNSSSMSSCSDYDILQSNIDVVIEQGGFMSPMPGSLKVILLLWFAVLICLINLTYYVI